MPSRRQRVHPHMHAPKAHAACALSSALQLPPPPPLCHGLLFSHLEHFLLSGILRQVHAKRLDANLSTCLLLAVDVCLAVLAAAHQHYRQAGR
eukprot:366415-Chlamydomonas_euryale.AAC.12